MMEVTTAVESLAPYTAASARRLLLGTRAVFAGAIALAGAGFWFYLQGPIAPAIASGYGSLGLTAKQDSRGIHLSWDPGSEDIRRSRQGIVSIVDGKLRADIPLRARDLSAGRISYDAVSKDVEFRLKVQRTDGKWREGRPLVMHLASENLVSAPTDASSPEASGNGAVDRSSSGQSTVSTEAAISPTGQGERRSFRVPAAANTPVRSRAIPDAPEAQSLAVAANSAGLEILENLPPSVRPAPPARPTAGKPAEATWTPPITSAVLVQRVQPVVPPDLERMIDREIRLSVRLTINESGDVVDSRQLGPKGTLADSLFRVAAETLHQWKYQPARLLSHPIATMIDVEFRFAPSR